MAKVAIYRYQLFDEATRAWRRAEGYGTAAYIAGRNGATLFHTKREVEESEGSPEGYFAPREKLTR